MQYVLSRSIDVRFDRASFDFVSHTIEKKLSPQKIEDSILN